MTTLYDAYEKCSEKKHKAWDYCSNLMREHDGKDLKIIGANTSKFSAGFVFEDANGDNCLMYITASSYTIIKLEE